MSKAVFALSSSDVVSIKLEKLITEYKRREIGSAYALTDAIHLLESKFQRVAQRLSKIHKGMIDAGVFLSAMYDGVWSAFEAFETKGAASFTTYLATVVNNKLKDTYKGSHGTHARNCNLVYESDTTEDEMSTVRTIEHADGFVRVNARTINYTQLEEIPGTTAVEDHVIERMMVDEQRDLINDIYEKSPEETKRIIEVYISDEKRSLGQVAAMTGTDKMKVSRRLKKLKGLFNPSRYGDLVDYIPNADLDRASAKYAEKHPRKERAKYSEIYRKRVRELNRFS